MGYPTRRATLTAAILLAVILAPVTAAGPASAAAGRAAVPATFRAASMTWLPAGRGWVLGIVPCGRRRCPEVIGTADGGRSWRQLGRVSAPIISQARVADSGVSEVRFATASAGWVFGPELFRTGNGGRTWTRATIPGHGRQVLALASGSAATYAVVSPCREDPSTCRATGLSLWRTSSPASRSWTRVRVHLAISPDADIATRGRRVYVVDPGLGPDSTGQLYTSADGRHFSARRSPCGASQDEALVGAAATSAAGVALLCDGNPGVGQALKIVYRSADAGRKDRYAGRLGVGGIVARIAASPSGCLLVSAWSTATFMYLNRPGTTTWRTVVDRIDGGLGWNDLSWVSRREAWIVYGPVDQSAADVGRLNVSRDGGRQWSRVTP